MSAVKVFWEVSGKKGEDDEMQEYLTRNAGYLRYQLWEFSFHVPSNKYCIVYLFLEFEQDSALFISFGNLEIFFSESLKLSLEEQIYYFFH